MPEFEHDDEIGGTLDDLIADILAKKISTFDLLRSAPSGDYEAYVQRMRLFMVISRDPRIAEIFLADVSLRAKEAGVRDNDAIEKELARKDGPRRFPKLLEERAQAFNAETSLLSGTTFADCLAQYKALLAYVEKLWADACQLYTFGNFPLAAFISILVIEEVGKLSRIAHDLVLHDVPRAAAQDGAIDRNHRRKHFLGVVSGALINARLDRVLGKDVIRRLLHDAESDELEKTRQSCLYIDMQNGRAVTPFERIDGERARVLTVLAGELIAEVLGHFPWEFERMLNNAIAFERAIGMPEQKIVRR